MRVDRYDALVDALRAEIPGFRDRPQGPVARCTARSTTRCVVVTFGQMRSYLDSYQTTIGKTVYVTADWDDCDADERYVTLRHEAVHLRQFRKLHAAR